MLLKQRFSTNKQSLDEYFAMFDHGSFVDDKSFSEIKLGKEGKERIDKKTQSCDGSHLRQQLQMECTQQIFLWVHTPCKLPKFGFKIWLHMHTACKFLSLSIRDCMLNCPQVGAQPDLVSLHRLWNTSGSKSTPAQSALSCAFWVSFSTLSRFTVRRNARESLK